MSLRTKGNALVNVIMISVILIIVATAAVPSYVNSRSDDKQDSINGVAGALGSASAINYAVRTISRTHGIAVTNCVDVINTLEGTLDAQYTIITAPVKAGAKVQCTVVDKSGAKATFIAQGIS